MKLQKAKIAKVIRGDATLEGSLYDGKGHYCVIGGLLHAVGFPVRKLCRNPKCTFEKLPPSAKEALLDHYGLGDYEGQELMSENDGCHETTKARRRDLLAKLKEF